MKADCYVDEGVAVVRGTNLGRGRSLSGDFVYITAEKATELGNANLKPDDLVFPHRGAIGEVGIVPDDGSRYALSTSLMKITLDKSRALPDFYYYFFTTSIGRSELLKNASQVGTPGIATPLKSLRECVVPCPSPSQQLNAVGVLRSIDDRIEHLRQTNATLEAIAQALFKSWFVDFDPVRAKAEGREPVGMDAATAALFPSEFEDSELGPIPRGWVRARSGDLFDVGIGKTPPRKEPQWFSEDARDIRWVSIRDMGESGCFIAKTSESLTQAAVERFNVRVVPDETVLLSFKLTVGRLVLTDGPMTTNEAIAHFKAKAGSLPQTFLYCYLSSYDMASLASTSSIATATNSKAIRDLTVLHPGNPVAVAFDRHVRPSFMQIRNRQRQATTLAEIRDTLLPRLISGKLRLPEAEAQVEAIA